MPRYQKIGLLAARGGRVLLCRKKGPNRSLILPGGCLEPGESAEACLAREIAEELGGAHATNLRHLGAYTDRAAGGGSVHIELYGGELEGTPAATSEIAELVWFGSEDDWSELAPSLAHTILPDLAMRSILPWQLAPVAHSRVELLAPARDFECGKTAIDCGADAVYIGAPRFGARVAVGNSLEDIAALSRHAHLYWARVYVTLNTLLFDEEMAQARDLAWRDRKST